MIWQKFASPAVSGSARRFQVFLAAALLLAAPQLRAVNPLPASNTERAGAPAPQAGQRPAAAEKQLPARAAGSAAAGAQIAARVPLYFEKNEGQADRRAGFLARMPNATLYLTGADVVLVHPGKEKNLASALRMSWLGASSAKTPVGEAEMTAKSNYFIGNDSSRWHTGVANFQRVRQAGLYPGVDLVYYGNQQQLEYDLTVQAGVSPDSIRLRVEGASSVALDKATGDLVLVDAIGSPLRLLKPVVYQMDEKRQKSSVSANYALSADNTVSFVVGSYDRSRPLVIDPEVVYSTVYGGTLAATSGYPNGNSYTGMTVDSNGFVYLGGITEAINLPTTAGSFQPACAEILSGSTEYCSNFFVAKFDPTQSGAASLVYATYIGGATVGVTYFQFFNPSSISILTVDSSGDAYFGGSTDTDNYPTTSNAFAPACNLTGAPRGSICPFSFLTKLNPTGSALLYSTWLEPYLTTGGGLETPGMIAVDGSQNAYIAGETGTGQYYLAAYATTQSGNASFSYSVDVPFVPTAIAADPIGNVYLGGGDFSYLHGTNGLDGNQFINLNGAQTTAPNGSSVGILVRFNSAGQNTYATLIGSGSNDIVTAVSVDSDGTAYATGKATDLVQVNGLPSAAGGTSGNYVAKYDTTQTGTGSLLYSTYINSTDIASIGYGISSNGSGQFAFSGEGIQQSTYQLVNPLIQPSSEPEELASGYPYVGVIDTTKSGQDALIFLSFLDGVEYAFGAFLDQSNNAYVAGSASTIAPQSPFLSLPSSYLSTLTPAGVATPVFFYKIALGPVDMLSISPSILAFASEALGTTSPPLSFTVTNTGNSSVDISGVEASSQFNETDNCTGSLAAGATCTVQVTFEPTAQSTSASPTTGAVSLTVPGSNAPLSENVTGIGVTATTPTAVLSPQSIAFGSWPNGSTSSSVTVTLTNTGTVALSGEGSAIVYLSTYPGEFTEPNTACGTTLAVGASCQITVAFAPTTATATANGNSNSYSQTLYAFFNNNYEATATLTGTGIAAGPASATLSATTLTFPSTAQGSSSGPQTITLKNTGTATLAGISVSSLAGGGASSYGVAGSCGSTITSLTTGQTCNILVTFTPQASGPLTASLTVSDNGTPLQQTVFLTGTGKTTPSINWPTPAAITYGTPLSGTQLDATSTVAGNFAYTPSSGVLTAGTHTLSVTFTPNDATDYTTASTTVQLTVNPGTPTINWPTPAAITYGTPLSGTQLDATSTVAGNFAYTPSSGVLTAGTHTLSVTFTPNDATDYTTASTTVQLTVNQVTPTINWPTPAAITYGTALSGAQFDATTTVAGNFVYTPSSGVFGAGSHTLSVTFTPNDSTDYTTASTTVNLAVSPALLTVTANNTSMTVGAALPTFTASYSGFVNGDGVGVLSGSPAFSTTATNSSPAGTYPITVTQGTLTAANYTFAFVNGTLSVVQAPAISLTTSATVSGSAGGGYTETITVKNTGTGTVTGLTLTSATLGSASGSPLPQTLGGTGTLAAGASNTFTVTFSGSAGADGAGVPEKYSGICTGGSFSASVRSVTLP